MKIYHYSFFYVKGQEPYWYREDCFANCTEDDLNGLCKIKPLGWIDCDFYNDDPYKFITDIDDSSVMIDMLTTDEDALSRFLKYCFKYLSNLVFRKKDPETIRREEDGRDLFEVGEPVIYQNGDRYELGVVKQKSRSKNPTYFCYYHTGDTAAATPQESLHKISNRYAFKIIRLDPDGNERKDN